MKQTLTLFLLAFLATTALLAQTVYEDFDANTGLITWQPFGDGTYNGVVTNPDPNFINDSDNAGSYTKSDMAEFSLFIGQTTDPIDLSVNNQFSIDIYAGAATSFIFKIEGGGDALEQQVNIPLANVWYRYTFDMSAAANFTGINSFVLFFDEGVEDSADTYLFDNLVANPAGPCAGTTPDPLVIDDFECQRNVTYGGGFDILEIVANPDPSGINTSATVGSYEDPQDMFSALVLDYDEALDLTTFNQVSAQVWAPVTGNLVFKLEGGTSAPFEVSLPVTQTESWVEYTADFSSQAGENHTRIAIFFNIGVTPDAGDVYFIDNLTLAEGMPQPALEDFEMGANLPWMPLNNNTMLNGTFAVIANPDATAPNESTMVGQYTKGNAAFSTVSAFLPNGIDLSAQPQLNLQVWVPAGGTEVTMQLVSALQGNKEVTREVENGMTWTDLNFNFEEDADIQDFERINLLFNPGTAEPGTIYYFDNLTQGTSTVDPCENVVAVPRILDDYECQRNVNYTVGGDQLNVIPNPDPGPANQSGTVGEFTDGTGTFEALVAVPDAGGSLDLSLNNQFRIKVWAPVAGPMLVKLEGGASAPVEVTVDITETEQWIDYTVDFSGSMDGDFTQVVLFFNAGVSTTEDQIYYIDDLQFTRDSYRGCIGNFENEESIQTFQYFANGTLEAQGKPFEIVMNPTQSGINTSNNVGEFVKAGDALPFAGMFTNLDAPLNFQGNKSIRAMVLMDHIGNFAIKLEGSTTGADPIELAVDNTLVDEWEELTFDFSAVPDDADYRRITVFFDLGIDATGMDVASYFDNLVIGEGSCTTVSTFGPRVAERFAVSPNPVAAVLNVDVPDAVRTLRVVDALGRTRLETRVLTATQRLDVAQLEAGVYYLIGENANGNVVANGRFVRK